MSVRYMLFAVVLTHAFFNNNIFIISLPCHIPLLCFSLLTFLFLFAHPFLFSPIPHRRHPVLSPPSALFPPLCPVASIHPSFHPSSGTLPVPGPDPSPPLFQSRSRARSLFIHPSWPQGQYPTQRVVPTCTLPRRNHNLSTILNINNSNNIWSTKDLSSNSSNTCHNSSIAQSTRLHSINTSSSLCRPICNSSFSNSKQRQQQQQPCRLGPSSIFSNGPA